MLQNLLSNSFVSGILILAIWYIFCMFILSTLTRKLDDYLRRKK